MNKIQTYLLEAIVGIHQWQEQEVHCLAKVRYITNHWNLHGITCKYMENSKWQTNKTGRNEVQIDIICGIVCPMIHEGNIASYLNKENGQKEDWIDLFPYTKCNPNINNQQRSSNQELPISTWTHLPVKSFRLVFWFSYVVSIQRSSWIQALPFHNIQSMLGNVIIPDIRWSASQKG